MATTEQLAHPRRLSYGAAIRAEVARWEGAAALLLAAVVFSAVQGATPNIIGIDGYYHIKVAALMREYGPRLDFPWLQLTILGPGHYTDHHFLFHALQAPFTVGDLRVGAKMAAVLFATLGAYTAYAFLARHGVRYAFLWLGVLLACAHTFLWRHSMARPQGLSLAVLVLALWVLFDGRRRLLLPLGFAAAWLFDGFFFILSVPALALAAQVGLRLVERWGPRWGLAARSPGDEAGISSPREGLVALGWTSLGIILGILAHPYFPRNLEFAYLHLLPKAGLGSDWDIRVGLEWYPYSPLSFFTRAGPATALTVLGLVPPLLALRRGRLPDWRTMTLAGFAFVLLAMVMRSQRLIEYFPAFAALFCAWSWSRTRLDDTLLARRLAEAVARVPSIARPAGWWPALAVALLAPALIWALIEARGQARNGRAWDAYREPAAWLAANTPPRARVFNTDWDDFPYIFYWNTHNVYLVGLDPTYMSLYDRELYVLWRNVAAGQVRAPARTIRESFGAEYVLSDRRRAGFLRAAAQDPDLEEVLRTPSAVVFRVRGAEGR